MNVDVLSKFLKQAIDSLFLSSPFKTSMGVLLGISADGFSVLLPEVDSVPWYAWISICIFILNFDNLIKRNKVSNRSQRLLDIIERGRKDGLISSQEAKQRFRYLIQQEIHEHQQDENKPIHRLE